MSKRTEKRKHSGKNALTLIKEWITVEDWRAALALIVTIGGLVIIFWSLQYGKDVAIIVTPPITALITIVLDHYFTHKRES